MKKQKLIKLENLKNLFLSNNTLFEQIKCNNTAIIKLLVSLSIDSKYLEFLGEMNLVDSFLLHIIKTNENFAKSIQTIIHGLNK